MPTITVSRTFQFTSSKTLLVHLRRCILVVMMALSILITPALASNIFAQEETIHVVRAGESLSTIAARYGVSVSTLARHNGLSNTNIIRVGQVIRIPRATLVPAATPIPVAPQPRLIPENAAPRDTSAPVATPHIYEPGRPTATSTPVIPTPVPAQTFHTHTVRASETLSGIASLYSTTVWAIKARNGITGDKIYVGQRLIIP